MVLSEYESKISIEISLMCVTMNRENANFHTLRFSVLYKSDYISESYFGCCGRPRESMTRFCVETRRGEIRAKVGPMGAASAKTGPR